MENENLLLPALTGNVKDRLEELLGPIYRGLYNVDIKSIKGYEGPLPELKPLPGYQGTTRAFPDGFEVVVAPWKPGNYLNGRLIDTERKYLVEFEYENPNKEKKNKEVENKVCSMYEAGLTKKP